MEVDKIISNALLTTLVILIIYMLITKGVCQPEVHIIETCEGQPTKQISTDTPELQQKLGWNTPIQTTQNTTGENT